MEKTPNARPTVGNKPAKKNSNNAEFSNKDEAIYCVLCRSTYPRHDVHEHMHSMLHHRELENVLGKDSFHDCQACAESAMGLNEYAQHISSSQHKTKLKIMMLNGVKPISLHNTVGKEMMAYIMERNKWLKCQKKNETKSNYKKLKRKKQEAGQSYAEMVQGTSGKKNTAVSKVSKQVDTRILKQMQEEGKNIVRKNKENKVSSLQRPPHQNEETLQNESGRLSCLSGGPSGQTWQHPNVRDQFTQWTQQMRYEDNFPVSIYGTKCKLENTQVDKLFDRPKVTQEEATYPPEQKTWPATSQNGHYYEQCCNAADGDFTCDHLPQNGALIFDQKESPGSSRAGQKGSDLTSPASENNTAPIRDANVSAMLRHIRRALGVREPCRADREARRQRSDNVTSYVATSVQSSQVSSPTPTSHPGSHTTNETPARPKQTTLKTAREVTQRFEKISRVAGDSNGASNNREKESQVAVKSQALLSQQLGGAASSDPNMNITSKVRVARKATRNLLNLSGALSRQSWTDMYKEMKKKKLAKVRAGSSNRFGIKLVKTTERTRSTQAEESDMPLSEGFHWESLPHSPSAEPWTALPPFLQDTTVNNSHTETTQSDVRMQEPLELPCQAQDNDQSVTVVPVKVEPKVEGKSGKKRSSSTASKRKPIVVVLDDISDEPPSVKKKRTKSHTGLDQLLTVSLREEELSHSIQDLDNSLIQARNALQAAYTEVQRLLLLRQQCTAEVDSLRAKRIEILQGMQGGYTTSSAGAAAAVPPILSPLPSSAPLPASSTQQSLSTNPTSSSTQPCTTTVVPLTLQLKQEMCKIPTVSCNPNTPPINQPVQLFPSNLLPPLLLASPHQASPTTAVTPLQHLSADGSKLGKTSPESSTRLLAQPAREGLKECEKTEGLVGKKEEEADAAGEKGGNVQAAESRSSAALDEDKGNESDDSVRRIEPSNIVVIDTDESEKEEAGCNLPVHKEHQKAVSMEFSSSGRKTKRENDVDRTVEPAVKDTSAPPVRDTSAPPVKDTSASPEYIEVSDDEELYLGAFENHAGSVLGLQVCEGRLYTCSGDNTARAYSLTSRKCQLVFEGHTNKVNCLLVASLPNTPACLYTGSSDQTIRCYNTKTSECLEQITLSDRVLCLHVAWNILFAGLADGSVASYDLKTLRELDVLDCHGPRGVSCLGTAQEGARRVLLVGSYDSTISVRDAKSGLLLRSLGGHTKTVLCMKVVNDLVFSGSSDMSVHAYNIHTGELLRIYKAHGHAVTSIVILGKVMVTACLDQLVRVYELQSQDRLQVYGGHSDMVMCMAVHKNVIYTGCYDGSVQALEFNLMKNHRCWWQNCSLIFGLAEHLMQHLVRDHSNPNLQTVKCRWRSCSSFFSTQLSVRQELPDHMKSHVQKDSEVQPGPSL
ncbi:zinc finger protein 106 [Notolabrus celidotus]|uniref:zinc finger protein 106 n=1 Tax=Notolabrus celidotus TaxID=1203425 RepID=UPI0014907B0D|nr:zinc finger protein 106 [Notolabrus celidotus]XP_034554980.1 zinc finger protein 106 [Notolabrus celidotus]